MTLPASHNMVPLQLLRFASTAVSLVQLVTARQTTVQPVLPLDLRNLSLIQPTLPTKNA